MGTSFFKSGQSMLVIRTKHEAFLGTFNTVSGIYLIRHALQLQKAHYYPYKDMVKRYCDNWPLLNTGNAAL